MRTIGTVFVLALLFASSARADERPITSAMTSAFQSVDWIAARQRDAELQRIHAEERERQRVERERLNVATAVFIGTAGADWAVTAACFKVRCADRAGHASSFFVAGEGFKHTGTAFALGLGLDAALVLLAREVVADEHPKLARGLLWVASGVRIVILTNKVNDLREHARRR